MSNIYDNRYEIRLAQKSDINNIILFLQNNWNENHILVKNRKLFEYEFLEDDGTVNFIIAIDKDKKSIESLIGVLKSSHDPEVMDIWGSIWKTLDGNIGFLGVELIKRRHNLYKFRHDLHIGLNPTTAVPIMKLLKRHIAKMKHYYMLSEIDDFKIAHISYIPSQIINESTAEIIKYDNIEQIKKDFDVYNYKEISPFKDYWYINHRFFENPIYKYDVYGIKKNNVVNAIFVLRLQEYEKRVAIRFVDYIGNKKMIPETGQFFKKLLNNKNYEYVDFYCYGFDSYLLSKAGFSEIKENDKNIIPNYFYPFVQKNIDIWVDSPVENSCFTKADGDQDRPN